ncbi:MAG: hypothetical protein IPK82_29720 [Polyangiaceae bacterium]|nr:hypothetical protein [Polyangiaceae bacterium]
MRQQRLFLRLAAVFFAALSWGCTPPLSEPGERGSVSDPPPVDTDDFMNASGVIELNVDTPIPTQPACGVTYLFSSRADETPVECEGLHYGILYREALRHADERVAEFNCPDECPVHPCIVSSSASCSNDRGRVELGMAITCVPEGGPTPEGLPIRTDVDLQSPYSDKIEGTISTPNEVYSIELRPNDYAEDCPFDFKYWLTLNEKVSSCDAVTDYTPFVARAEAEAKKIGDATKCVSPCSRQAVSEVGASWNCSNNTVQVKYLFAVPCT